MRYLAALLLALALAACSAPEPQPARPAFWQVEGANGANGWLFGTIHSLDRPAQWRSAEVDRALNASDRIVVEVGDLADQATLQKLFAEMSRSPGLPPLSQRIDPALKSRLDEALRKANAREETFANVETWAAALVLARAGQGSDKADNGIDRAVLAAASGRPVVELEGARRQFGIFDTLPEKEQRDLLTAVLNDAEVDAESVDVAASWRTGDMAKIEAETHEGLLADPELRQALFTTRNRDWAEQLTVMLNGGARPFVAVGAAHMAGPEGLPALLAAKGFKVTRVQ